MTSTDLLEDYNVLRDIIFDGIKEINDDLDLNNLKDANIKVYLNNLKDEIGSDASTSTAYIYIDSILNEIDKINIYDVEDDDSKTELEIKKQTIIQKKKSLKIYQMSLIVLFGGLGLFIFVKTITNYRNSDKRSKTNILKNELDPNNPTVVKNMVFFTRQYDIAKLAAEQELIRNALKKSMQKGEGQLDKDGGEKLKQLLKKKI